MSIISTIAISGLNSGLSAGILMGLGLALSQTVIASAAFPTAAVQIAQGIPEDWKLADYVGSLDGHSHPIQQLISSPDGRYLLGLTEYEMVLWDVEIQELVRFFPGHTAELGFEEFDRLDFPARRAAFSTDGRFIVSVFDNGGLGTAESLLIWDIASGSKQPLGTFQSCRAVAVAADRMATACDDGVQLWDLSTGTEQSRIYSFAEGGRPVETLALSPDSRILATADLNATGGLEGEDGTRIRLWQWGKQGVDPLGELSGHSGDVHQLAFSPDQRYLISTGFDQQAIVWGWQAGQSIAELDYGGAESPLVSLVVSPDAQLLVGDFRAGEMLQLPTLAVVRDVLIPRAGGFSAYSFVNQGQELAWAGQPPTFANPVVQLFSSNAESWPGLPPERAAFRELELKVYWNYPLDGPHNAFFGQDPEMVAQLGVVPLELLGGGGSPEDPEIETEVVESTAQRHVVTVSVLGIPDDSVANIRYRVELAPYGSEGSWKVIWAGEHYQCQPNRGQQTWGVELCR
ncbi:MAG: WD40 repeat domain-containing protein [Cyanophyceae cyanobacterium]